MTKPRVVVEGLKGAIQQVRPTVPSSYGTTPVNVIQTPSWQDTQLGQLARVLGVGVQIAGEVKQIGDIKEQEAIDALADKSIEEVNAEALQNRNEFDKLNRKLNLPFMSNPWNQERVRKAAGAQFHDEFQLRLQQALDKSDAATATDTVVQDVITGMTEDYESLKDITIRQGFDAATKSTIQQYSLRYNALKNQQNENELFRGGRSVMFNGATLITDQNGVTKMADSAAIDEWWADNEGALKPARLAELRKTVATDLAYRDPDSARAFLKHTQGFKAGTTKMGDPDIKDDDVFSMYSAEEAAMYEAIDKIELQDQTKNVHAARQELAVIDELAVDMGMAIREKKVFVTEEGEQISTEKQAETYLLNKLQQSDNILVRGSDGVKTIQNSLKLLETEPDNFIPFFNKIRNAGLDTIFNQRITQSTEAILRQHLIEDPSKMGDPTAAKIINPIYKQYATEITFELLEERRQKIRELSSGSYLNVNGEEVRSTAWDSEVMEDQARWDRNFNEQFRSRLNDRIAEHNKKIAGELAAQNEVKRRGEVISGVKSFVEPGKVLSEITSAIGNTWGNLETKLRLGYNKAAASIADEFETNKEVIPTTQSQLRLPTVPIMRDPFETRESKVVKMTRLEHALSLVQSTSTTSEQKKAANNKIAMYLMAKGPQYYTAENIRKGSVDINIGATPETTRLMPVKQAERQGFTILERGIGALGVAARVKVPAVEGITHNIKIDKEALKRLIGLYPLISEERLNEIKAGVESYEPEKELYEALFDVTLTEGDEGDEKTLREFIDTKTKLLNKFKK